MKPWQLLPTALGLALSACNPAYVAPKSSENAQVRFNSPQSGGFFTSVGVYAFDNTQCNNGKKIRQLGGMQMLGVAAKRSRLSIPKNPDKSYKKNTYFEVPVQAGERFNFTMNGAYPGASCMVTMSFLPEVNRSYEVDFLTLDRRCVVVIERVAIEGGEFTAVPETSARMNDKQCRFFWN